MKHLVLSALSIGLVSSLAFSGPLMASDATAEKVKCDVEATDLPVVGHVSGHVDSVGFMAGARWGKGTLKLESGEEKKFDILGFKILETGISATDFEGEVYNLKSIDDFVGTYYGASSGITAIVGDGQAVFNNANCVIVRAKGSKEGIQLSAPGAAGIEISWDD